MNPAAHTVPVSSAATAAAAAERRASLPATSPIADELGAVAWIHEQVLAGQPLPLVEARAVVDSLFHEVRWGHGAVASLAAPDSMETYNAVHAVNVCMLSMALSRSVQFDDDAARRIGLAGLLHDIGMLRIDPELLARSGQLTAMEREQVKRHPEEGVRVILAADPSLDLAAVVAYEHHIKIDGSGYPRPIFRRSAHYVSRLVQVCDIYHALRSPRPFRPAWPDEIIASFLTERAGFEFHPALSASLVGLIRG